MNVLVIDDTPESTHIWQNLAVSQGFKVQFCRAVDSRDTLALNAQLLVLDRAALQEPIVEACAQLRNQFPRQLMLFTGKSFSTHEVVQLMHAGAHSVVQKPIDVERLTHFLEDIASKSLAMQAQEQEFLQLSDQFSTLTGREKDVLDCVLLGTSNKETAQQLKVSVRTVESRRAKVYRKLSAANVAELVRRVDRLMQLRQHFEEQQNKSRTDVRIDDCALRHDSRPRQSPHWSESLRRIGI